MSVTCNTHYLHTAVMTENTEQVVFSARQHICLARYMLSPVRPSVCQTRVSSKNGCS